MFYQSDEFDKSVSSTTTIIYSVYESNKSGIALRKCKCYTNDGDVFVWYFVE